MLDNIQDFKTQVLNWQLHKNTFKLESDGSSIMESQISTLDAKCHQIDVNNDSITHSGQKTHACTF